MKTKKSIVALFGLTLNIFILSATAFNSSMAHSQDKYAPEQNYPPIVMQGSYANEANCFAAYSSEEEKELGAFVYPGEHNKKKGFYALTGRGIHFFPVSLQDHKECFEAPNLDPNDTGRHPYSQYYFQVNIPGAETYYVTYNDPGATGPKAEKAQADDRQVRLVVRKDPPERKNLCKLANHEALTTEAEGDLETELVERIGETHHTFKEATDERLRLRREYPRSDFPPGNVGDIAYNASKRTAAVNQQLPLPNPQSSINQIRVCSIVRRKRAQAVVEQQLRKFRAPTEVPALTVSPKAVGP